MQNHEFETMDINEELEFNNGVGDALKQKKEYSFSWKKTAIVLSSAITMIVLVTFGVLEVGKNALNINQQVDVSLDSMGLDSMPNESIGVDWDVLPPDTPGINKPSEAITGNEENHHEENLQEENLQEEKPAPMSNSTTTVKAQVTAVSSPSIYRVIAGSFSNYNNAKIQLQKVKSLGFDGYIWSLTSTENNVSFKVQVGAFKTRAAAQRLIDQLAEKNISSFITKH